MSNAFVTGGSGFIGFHLVRALVDRGDEVTCLVRRSSQRERVATLTRLGARIIEAELTDVQPLEPALSNCDIVYHLAGATRARSRREFLQVNARATLELLTAAAKRTSPPAVVFVSSLAAAGPSPRGQPRREADPPRPVSRYGMSKLVAEMFARSVADKLPISIVRPPMVLGPGDSTSVELFRALQRVPLHFMPGFRYKQYSLVFAEDLAQGLIATAERGERLPAESAEDIAYWTNETAGFDLSRRMLRRRIGPGASSNNGQGLYYIASDQRITYAELGRLVAQAAGRSRVLNVSVPKAVMWCLASCNEIVARARGRATFFGWDKWREATTGDWTCSPAKAREQLGFQTNDDLPGQIRTTFEWYRDQGWLS
ncbi:MAG: NAD-dependent epimerase/dehydratase family protein [Pirellulales bacterium]